MIPVFKVNLSGCKSTLVTFSQVFTLYDKKPLLDDFGKIHPLPRWQGMHPNAVNADKKVLLACAVLRLFCCGLCLEGDPLRRAHEADRSYREPLFQGSYIGVSSIFSYFALISVPARASSMSSSRSLNIL